jgi:lipoprotein-anchoring transpeptidase ErfK/SrfK
LDRRHFSPGCLDGRWGRQSRQALAAWQTVNRLPPTGSPDPATRATLGDLQNLLVDYPVDPVDYVNLAPLPITWKEKSKVFSLGYETAQESIAEKFHLAQAALVRLNPTAPWPNPPVGTFLKVPDLRGKRPPFAARLEISLSNKWLRAYSTNNSLIAHFPCSIGADEARRPVGDLVILKAAVDPIYVFDPAVFPESPEARTLRGKLIIPGGPNNPVGVAWIGLNKPGYGIHGTPIPEDIGKTESHGCFRLANWNARKMVSMIVTGTPVRVKP